MTSVSNTQLDEKTPSVLLPMFIIGVLFFAFGFITWLNGSLIPFLKIVCDLSEFQALFVTFAFYIAYTVMAWPVAGILQRIGYRNGIAAGLAVVAVGSLLFIPAAYSRQFMVFLTALFVLGSGLTMLQTASNPYVVKIGPQETAAVRISIMGLINKLAGVLAPITFTALVFGGFSEAALLELDEAAREASMNELAGRLVIPYFVLAAVSIGLVALVKFSGLPELDLEQDEAKSDSSKSIFSQPHTVLGALTLFFYVGIEVIAGDTIGLFGQKLGVENFASLTSYTMVFMVFGYLIGVTCIPRFISQPQALLGSAVAGLLCVLGATLASTESTAISSVLWGWAGIGTVPDTIAFVAIMGLANALVWPAVWPLALDGLGKQLGQGSALLIMGIAGGAIVPLLFGQVADTVSTQSAYWVGLGCYGFILFYALRGHKLRSW